MKSLSVLFLALISFSSCGIYSFSGANTSAKTATVHLITNQANIVVPSLSNNITEKLKDKIITGSTVAVVDNNGELDFSGSITSYAVTPIGAQANETAARNRLTITVSIDFKNTKDEKQNWTQSFSRFADYDSNKDLASVEQSLIEEITTQIVNDIFNKALVNW